MKFIIFSIIAFYLLFKVIGFLFRLLIKANLNNLRTSQSASYQNQKNSYKRAAPDSNVNIDYVPGDRSKADYKGGEYVEYEEVK